MGYNDFPAEDYQITKDFIDKQFGDVKDDFKLTPGGKATYVPPCSHPPTLIIDHEGFRCSVGKKWDCELLLDEFDVAVNLTGSAVAGEHHIPIPALKKWETFPASTEIVLDWPDYGVVNFPVEFWEELIEAVKGEGGKMVLFCQGGHGRTGTALACLMIVHLGYGADEAIDWIRDNYCAKAIESKKQEDYIRRIAEQVKKRKKNAKK